MYVSLGACAGRCCGAAEETAARMAGESVARSAPPMASMTASSVARRGSHGDGSEVWATIGMTWGFRSEVRVYGLVWAYGGSLSSLASILALLSERVTP